MRRFTIAALMLAAVATLSCRKQRTNETGGVSDTAGPPPAATTAPAPETAETPSSPTEFGFDQRQGFIQSIRQQLTGMDQQIRDLSAQAKSRGGAVSDRALSRIRASRAALDSRLNRVNTATAANWDQFKRDVNQAVDNLNESIEAAQPK